MTELGARQRSASDGIADLLDVTDEDIRPSTGVASSTVRRDTVKILRSDRNADNQVSEGGAVLGDSGFQSGDLVVERILASGGPETQKKGGLGVDSGLDRLNNGVLGSVLDHSVETSACPSIGTGQALCVVELVLEVDQSLRGIVVELGTVVEALDSRVGSGQKSRGGNKGRCEAHYDSKNKV